MKSKVKFGVHKASGETVYLTLPTWDCGWYWSFGYLGNRNWHYHLRGFAEGRNICMHDALLSDYDLVPALASKLWLFCELAQTAYNLKTTAEVLGCGGSRQSTNPCADVIKNHVEVERINTEVLPAVFAKIKEIFEVSGMTKTEALKEFREYYMPHIPRGDVPRQREEWNNYTDMLCKGRRITQRQYATWDNPF